MTRRSLVATSLAAQLGIHQLQLSLIGVTTKTKHNCQARCSHSCQRAPPVVDGRARLSGIWVPSGGITAPGNDSHSLLIRAGFLRQGHSGIFHMLPLGQRVQDKLGALVDKYMSKLSASKVELSSISSESLWERSGRLGSIGSELFRFKDRREAGYLLSPTHEEEITNLVSGAVHSYKELPLRLYQISRKYRDELRPRHGLLRSREFVMKDLYTFDTSVSLALLTYNKVKDMYSRLFDELKIPYLVAEADSGNMGGNLSHEFHFPTLKGDDHVISCNTCDYVTNEELARSPILPQGQQEGIHSPTESAHPATARTEQGEIVRLWQGISNDESVLINVWYMSPSSSTDEITPSSHHQVNIHAIKAVFPDLNSSVENPIALWSKSSPSAMSDSEEASSSKPRRILNLVDGRVSGPIPQIFESIPTATPVGGGAAPIYLKGSDSFIADTIHLNPETKEPLNLMRIRDGDTCPRCFNGTLKVQQAIELGHTFHLGTRYSRPLEANVMVPKEAIKEQEGEFELAGKASQGGPTRMVAMQMGCHGIGVTRMIGAVADTLADEKGLNWPRVMAPFELVVVPANGMEEAALEVYDTLTTPSPTSTRPSIDLALDDREVSFPWKMRDADLVGYPVIVVVGKRWSGRVCEVQCRRLQIREDVALGNLPNYIKLLLTQL